jgi:hypothetical protein
MRIDEFRVVRWARSLEDVDREAMRLARLCGISMSDVAVVERVLQNEESICGTRNPAAFAKLREMVMLHFAIRQQSADAIGQSMTAAIETHVIERLKTSFPDLAAVWPPA